jgi:glycosyltransferase involved in cell wall biosynthesis
MRKLSLVVPCYNEEAVIDRFDATARAVLDGLPVRYEICYVDDGSTDRTLARLRLIAAQHPRTTRYLSFSRNFGKEAGMLAGLRETTGDAVIIMDADLQHPPHLISRMLHLHALGHDQVIARRGREHDNPLRSALTRAYYRLVNSWIDVELTNGVGDFRLLSRPVVDALLSLPEYNRFSKGLFSWVGFDTVSFDYPDTARAEGQSKWRLGSLLNYGMDGLFSFNDRPLRTAIWAGIALAGLAGLYAVWVAVTALAYGVTLPGYVTLVAIVVGLGGVQMVMLGLIGEYIGRIYHEAKRRPHFLVKERHPRAAGDAGVRHAAHRPQRGEAL